jgi:chaperonin GroES
MAKEKRETKNNDKLNLQPLADRVVVQREEAEERTAGGIVLPDAAREKINRCQVVSVGPGRLDKNGNRVAMTVKPGDRVLINKWGGDEVKLGDGELVLVREDDILAVLDD